MRQYYQKVKEVKINQNINQLWNSRSLATEKILFHFLKENKEIIT